MIKINNYDSKKDTLEHIEKVKNNILFCTRKLNAFALKHDKSKLEEPEKTIFDEYTPKLKNTTYGSEEYKKYLNEMQVALKHHYSENTHHPEHFQNGIRDMNLIQLLEMFCDWLAATKRHADGNILESIKKNKERFGYSDELEAILNNTVELFEYHDIIEKLFDKDDSISVRKIVYDWWNGLNIYSEEYDKKYSESDLNKANSVIQELVSNGLG